MVTLRVGLGVVLDRAGVPGAGRDPVPDGDLLGADEDVFDQQPQDAAPFGGGGGFGAGVQLGQEALEVIGELEVGVAVGGLGISGLDLAAQAGLAGAQAGHLGPQLVDGDQLLGVGLDHRGDRLGGLGQRGFQAFALAGDRVAGAGCLQPFGDLGADQRRVGEQARDVIPDDSVEVVGADRRVSAHTAALIPVVVAAQASVVVDLPGRGAGRGAVVGVPAPRARGHALQQRGRDRAVAGGEPLVVRQPGLHALKHLRIYQGWDGISVHSSRGRSTVLTGRGTERPCSRATRFSPG